MLSRVSISFIAAGTLCMAGGAYGMLKVADGKQNMIKALPETKRANEIQKEVTTLLKGLDAHSALEKIAKDQEFSNRYQVLSAEYNQLMRNTTVQQAHEQIMRYEAVNKVMNGIEALGIVFIAASMGMTSAYKKKMQATHHHEI